MNALDYAEAIFLAAQGKDDATLDRLALRVVEVADMHGHHRMLPAIVRELARVHRAREHATGSMVRVARAEDADLFANRIGEDVQALGLSGVTPEVVCDDTLIGGYEVRTQGARIDRTYKRALVEIYTALISRS